MSMHLEFYQRLNSLLDKVRTIVAHELFQQTALFKMKMFLI